MLHTLVKMMRPFTSLLHRTGAGRRLGSGLGCFALLLFILPATEAAPEDWDFHPVPAMDRFQVDYAAIGNDGAIAFSGEQQDEQGQRVGVGVFYLKGPDGPVVPIALRNEALPGGLGRVAFEGNVRVDSRGRVLFQVELDSGGTDAVFRWEAGTVTRMLPDEQGYEHQLDYLSSDDRWIVEDRRRPTFDSKPILTDGLTSLRLQQGFLPQRSPCGELRRWQAVPNARGEALFLRRRWQDTEFRDEEGNVVVCSPPTTIQWSLVRTGTDPVELISGGLDNQMGTEVQFDIFATETAGYLYNDAGDVLLLREVYAGTFAPVAKELVLVPAQGPERVLLNSPPNGLITPFRLFGFDDQQRFVFLAPAGIFTGTDPDKDRVLGQADRLFGSPVLSCNALAMAGPSQSKVDRRRIFFSYTIEDGRRGFAVAQRRVEVDPAADTDGDGLLDTWETEGQGIDADGDGTIDFDLFALGARPDRKDLFVEIDATPSDRPMRTAALDLVVAAFARAPVNNPDGSTGIRLHLEIDEKAVRPELGATPDGEFPFGFREVTKPTHFGTPAQRADPNAQDLLAAKRRAYRYCLLYDFIDFPRGVRYLGIGEIGGNDFVVQIGERVFHDGFRDTEDQAATFMHELGHTLGLRHGGGIDEVIVFEPKSWQGKPNYPSIMNYALAHPHRWNSRFWSLDFCREELPTLNEAALDERAGISSSLYRHYSMPYGVGHARRVMRLARLDGRRIDFSGNGVFSSGVSADLNYVGPAAPFAGVDRPSPAEIMKGHNDWASIQYAVVDRDGAVDGDVPLADGCPTTEIHEQLALIAPAEADTYDEWIAAYAEEGPGQVSLKGFGEDPDGDGIANGIERYMGTDPARANPGIEVVPGADRPTFRHSRTPSPPEDLVASYQWSTDLETWHAAGATVSGVTVRLEPAIAADPGTPGETVEIVPMIEGIQPPTLFLRLRVERTGP